MYVLCACVVSSTVAAQYELFNKELGLDETAEPKKDEAEGSDKNGTTEQGTICNCIYLSYLFCFFLAVFQLLA